MTTPNSTSSTNCKCASTAETWNTEFKPDEIVAFLDSIGRVIFGVFKGTQNEQVRIKNPAILNIMPSESGGIKVQLLPVLFQDFLADRHQAIEALYNSNNITPLIIEAFDIRIQQQYKQIFNDNVIVVPDSSNSSSKEPKIETL